MENAISNKSTLLLAVFTLAVLAFIFSMMGTMMVIAVTDTGTVKVNITEVTEVNFTTTDLDWGAGSVNSGAVRAVLDSTAGTVTNGSWSTDSGELILENIGTESVNLDILSSVAAAAFIGGTSPTFKWNATEVDSSSCIGAANVSDIFSSGFTDVNTTSPGTRICTTFNSTDSKDSIKIDFELTIPSDTTLSGEQSATITATATEIAD